MLVNIQKLLPLAINAAEKAAIAILDVYNSGDFDAEAKSDNSPLTRADKNAHEIIVKILSESNLPVLSEEGRDIPYAERKQWEYFWMVDPLDGTKEFIKRNDEFTVNIALICNNSPVLGVVGVPVTGDLYYATLGNGAYLRRGGAERKLPYRPSINMQQAGLRVVASRSHMNQATGSFIHALNHAVLVSAGSSLKFTLLAEGKADLYPRFGPTMEWDTAAAHILVIETGMQITLADTNFPLRYNKENLLNPDFLCAPVGKE
ncbi:MAG: 3'(2'),5'-bisphosphate nucleotidase CysQ [Chryseolinea sp.]